LTKGASAPFFYAEFHQEWYVKIIGTGLQQFLAGAEVRLPTFRQRLPWLGADLQTVRNSLRKRSDAPQVHHRLAVPISGGQALSLAVTKPTEQVEGTPALILVHGLGGAEDSAYMEAATHYYSRLGWVVYRMNYRGVGPSAETSTAPYSAGLTGDMRSVLNAVAAKHDGGTIFAMGFSLGGQLLLRTAGEGDVNSKLKAIVTVSAPLDLSTSQQRLERPRNARYVRYLVDNMKRDMRGIEHEAITANIEAISSVLEFDEHVIARFFGFASAQDYYACVSCLPLIRKISVPALALHSADDPWIPVADYERALWPKDRPVGAVVVPRGGHVGFHGKAPSRNWYCAAAEAFFAVNM
jgi:predicted alpha/beta-fold hydrolase